MSEGPDGLYLTRLDGAWATNAQSSILYAAAGGTELAAPSFADPAADEASFYYSAERQKACFTSDRGDPGNIDIWCVDWAGDGWAEPRRLPEPVNSAATEYSPVLRPDGTLYFASARLETGMGDIYRATSEADGWQVEAVSEVNSEFGEWNLEISPDGETMIFETSGRPGNRSVSGDLYLSRRIGDNWSAAISLSRLNGTGSDLMPRFLSDGSLVFAKSSDDDTDIVKAEQGTWEPAERAIAAIARSAGELVLLDPETLAVSQRLPAGMGPHDIAISDDGRFAVVPSHGVFPAPHDGPIEQSEMRWISEFSDGFRVIDLVSGEPIAHRSLEGCLRPHGAAIAPQAERFWITCETEGHVREFDGETLEEVRRFELAEGVHKVMLLRSRSLLVASNPEAGGIDLIDLETGSARHIPTGNGAEGLAATADESRIFVTNGFDREVCAIDVEAQALSSCWNSSGTFPIGLAHDTQRNWVWAINNASSRLVAFDDSSGEVRLEVALPSTPLGLALDVGRDRLLIGLPRRNEIVAIDASTGEIVARSESVMEVDDIDFAPAALFRSAPDT
ncbi:hypothetical protein HFP57_08345 [Parasphingopyxis algicola]|uniref:PD40 domain-containing protein n=1 Tax=Parasphingopyxis algicola TaxID=2026624 RepID=UPI0015A3FCE4|nr:PD40 domain-containing protein [Parasphingopyxis algicola]QLC25035.1 hypothetical protein HFP57_08345 [Parasphingopyxis algicola]